MCHPLVVVPELLRAHCWEALTARLSVFKAQQELLWHASRAGLTLQSVIHLGVGSLSVPRLFSRCCGAGAALGTPVQLRPPTRVWQGGSLMVGSKPDIMGLILPVQFLSAGMPNGIQALTLREDLCVFVFPLIVGHHTGVVGPG